MIMEGFKEQNLLKLLWHKLCILLSQHKIESLYNETPNLFAKYRPMSLAFY